METNTRQFTTVNKTRSKLTSVFLFFIIMILNEACHKVPTEVVIQDEIRKTHSVELLSKKADNDSIKIFEGDIQFYDYIVQYVRKNNKKINAEKFTRTLLKISQEHNYDPIFLLAVIKTESSFNFNAVGSAGEIGLMQIKPDTAKWICEKKKIKWKGAKALKNPEYNMIVGALYFKYLKKTLKSQSKRYITAYNMGINSMMRSSTRELKSHPYFGKVTKNYITIYTELKKIKLRSQS